MTVGSPYERGPCSPIDVKERKRLVIVSLFVLGCYASLICQFYRIQVVEGDKWSRYATAQHCSFVVEPARRGLFYATPAPRKWHHPPPTPLVIDVPKFHLYIDPLAIPPSARDAIVHRIIQALSLGESSCQRVRAQLAKKSRSRRLVMWLDHAQQQEILSWWQRFAKKHKIARNALFCVQDWCRSYPYGKLLGQVLHTVREEKDPKTHRAIPTGGLEAVFDRFLSGKEGKREIVRSLRHPLDMGVLTVPPEHGADVYLTIDHYLQAVCEEEIEKGVQHAHAKAGWAILMDPRTGEILALAQYPWFFPTSYRTFFNEPRLQENTKVKAVTDTYEPGSTLKPITLAIGLLANEELRRRGKPPLFDPLEKIATSPRIFPGRSKPVKDVAHYRFLNMYMGVQKSSNVYMATIVQRIIEQLGAEWYRSCLADLFGFGTKTGIELPAESAGLVPRLGARHPNGTCEWSRSTPYSLAMGHNIGVTSMQMLRVYALIANGGFEVRPTLVREIRQATGEVLATSPFMDPQRESKRLLPPSVVAEMVKMLKYVTKKPGGLGFRADVFGFTEAGKSGTSEKVVDGQYSKTTHISTFIGFAPATRPCFVLMIAIDEPECRHIPGVGNNQRGGYCAAPVFRAIATRTLEYLGIEPDDPYGYPPGDPRSVLEKSDWYQEVQALKKLYDQWHQ